MLIFCRERDDLVTQVTRLRGRVEELHAREEEAYQQVKRSVEMVELAQLEQTQVVNDSNFFCKVR